MASGLTVVQNIPVPNVDKQIVLFDAPKLQQLRNDPRLHQPGGHLAYLYPLLLDLAALLTFTASTADYYGHRGVGGSERTAPRPSPRRSAGSCSSTSWPGTTFGPASTVFDDERPSYLIRGWQVLAWLGLILVVTGLVRWPLLPPAGAFLQPSPARSNPAVRPWPTVPSATLADGRRPTRAAGAWSWAVLRCWSSCSGARGHVPRAGSSGPSRSSWCSWPWRRFRGSGRVDPQSGE